LTNQEPLRQTFRVDGGAFWAGCIQHFRNKGWSDLLFDYTLDEPGDNAADYQEIRDRAALVHQADPDLEVPRHTGSRTISTSGCRSQLRMHSRQAW
jgi:hypothetical protein